jgi:hypothetical protein
LIAVIFAEGWKLWSSSLCNILQPPVTLLLSDPIILHSALFSDVLDLRSSFIVMDQDKEVRKQRVKITKYIMSTYTAPMQSLPFNFSNKNFTPVYHLSHACYIPTYIIVLDVMIVVVFGEEYKL